MIKREQQQEEIAHQEREQGKRDQEQLELQGGQQQTALNSSGMEKRVKTVLKAEGWYTKYQTYFFSNF